MESFKERQSSNLARSGSRVKDLQRMFDQGEGEVRSSTRIRRSELYRNSSREREFQEHNRDGLPALVQDHAINQRRSRRPIYQHRISESTELTDSVSENIATENYPENQLGQDDFRQDDTRIFRSVSKHVFNSRIRTKYPELGPKKPDRTFSFESNVNDSPAAVEPRFYMGRSSSFACNENSSPLLGRAARLPITKPPRRQLLPESPRPVYDEPGYESGLTGSDYAVSDPTESEAESTGQGRTEDTTTDDDTQADMPLRKRSVTSVEVDDHSIDNFDEPMDKLINEPIYAESGNTEEYTQITHKNVRDNQQLDLSDDYADVGPNETSIAVSVEKNDSDCENVYAEPGAFVDQDSRGSSSPVYDTPSLPTYSRPVPKNLRNNYQTIENTQTAATIENLGKGQIVSKHQKLRKQESTAGSEQPAIQKEVSNPSQPDRKFKSVNSSDFVGFSRLPDQIYKRSMRRGFVLNILVVGQDGLGKQTLLNSLFKTHIYGDSHSETEMIGSLRLKNMNLEEDGVKLKLRIVDSPGFGSQIDNSNCWQPIVDFIDLQFNKYMRVESSLNRSRLQMEDTRPHVCFYFIPPTGHGLRKLDIETLAALHRKVNIIPLIAKADSFTSQELAAFKREVEFGLVQNKISVFPLPYVSTPAALAVIGGEISNKSEVEDFRERAYPWGSLDIENQEFSDFPILRNIVLRENSLDLIERTHTVLYQEYRAEHLPDLKVGQEGPGSESSAAISIKDMEDVLRKKVEAREERLETYREAEEEKIRREMERLGEEENDLNRTRRWFEEYKKSQERNFVSKSLFDLADEERRPAEPKQLAGGKKLARSLNRDTSLEQDKNEVTRSEHKSGSNLLGLLTLKRNKKKQQQ